MSTSYTYTFIMNYNLLNTLGAAYFSQNAYAYEIAYA